ncbi:EI24 domain-containing protein [Aestuariivirga sp.]|uniref:EI24 domain-containing protein n=1 Tax=Aestuariivirga sp. TaxID=2650926 RepID=UPI0025C12B7A|nr:EI24 domain-containing protein [Aestuariivirga sp.]MCA3554334.1 EI24 domain-containing protein [Aestuariivirga sp.]
MLTSAFRAFGDLFSPEFRSVLFKALGLTVALFIAVLVIAELLIASFTQFSWPWADRLVEVGAGLALLVVFFFLIFPVTAAFAGLFLDQIAEKVEERHYPWDPRGTPLPAGRAILMAIQFFIVVLLVNLAVLPTVFFGFGVFVLIAANAYLIGREYFEMVAMRHMPVEEAKILRKENSQTVFVAALLPAVMSLVPIVNLTVPLFSTAYFTHLFKSVQASSA